MISGRPPFLVPPTFRNQENVARVDVDQHAAPQLGARPGLPIGVAVLGREDVGRVISGLVQRLKARHFEEVVRHRPEQRAPILGQRSFGMQQGVRPPDRSVVSREILQPSPVR